MQVSRATKDVIMGIAGYFAVFFVIMLGYRYFDAVFVKHVTFEFDLVQNVGLPAFAGAVGGVTKAFGGTR